MRNPVLAIAIAFVIVAPCASLAGDKNKNKAIEVQDYGFGVSMPVTTSRSDGGGATVGRKTGIPGLTAKGTLDATGPTKPPLPTSGTQHR